MFEKRLKSAIAAAVAALLVATSPGAATAQTIATPQAESPQRVVVGEKYTPSIWVDPDGCEHWVMDDGAEGYMTPHTDRQGRPVCRRGKVCGVMPTDQFFATDKWAISAAGQQRLREFFASAQARSGFIITGHTDSRASDEYNMALSVRRANSVARVAKSIGARIVDVRGYGERQPRASNDTRKGMAANRRVEIICLQ